MGTSTSFRSPAVPRWQAFATALRADVPLERLRSELFNAGEEWELALSDQSIATFAVQIVRSFEALPDRLRAAERPETAILDTAAEARRASAETGNSSAALPLAERALVAALVRAAAGDVSLGQLSPQEAAARFEQQRGAQPDQLLGSFVGELLSQYARHVTSREMGAMSEPRTSGGVHTSGLSIAQSKSLVRSLANEALSVGTRLNEAPRTAEAVRARWSTLVSDAFARGRDLPETRR